MRFIECDNHIFINKDHVVKVKKIQTTRGYMAGITMSNGTAVESLAFETEGQRDAWFNYCFMDDGPWK